MLLVCKVVTPTATVSHASSLLASVNPDHLRHFRDRRLSSNQPWVGEGVEMTAGSPHIHAMSTRKRSTFSNWPL